MHLSLLHSLTAEVEVPQQKLGKILLATPVAPVDGSEGPPDGGERPAKKSSALRFMLKENCAPAAPHQKWASASPAAREKIERDAVIANIIRQNHKKVAEERGIPFDAFHQIWREYTETLQYRGVHQRPTPPNPALFPMFYLRTHAIW